MKDYAKRVERDVFRIMRHKIPGKRSEVELKCYRMAKVAGIIYRRFSVTPYAIKLKHIRWYFEEIAFWDTTTTASSQYRYYLAVKHFCECSGKWGHWGMIIQRYRPL